MLLSFIQRISKTHPGRQKDRDYNNPKSLLGRECLMMLTKFIEKISKFDQQTATIISITVCLYAGILTAGDNPKVVFPFPASSSASVTVVPDWQYFFFNAAGVFTGAMLASLMIGYLIFKFLTHVKRAVVSYRQCWIPASVCWAFIVVSSRWIVEIAELATRLPRD